MVDADCRSIVACAAYSDLINGEPWRILFMACMGRLVRVRILREVGYLER